MGTMLRGLLTGVAVSSLWLSNVAIAQGTRIGVYCGSLNSAGHMVPARTELFSDGIGGMTGTYQFDDAGQTYQGKLTRGRLVGAGEWLLRWQDEFGRGTLDIQFGPGTYTFDGKWGPGQEVPSLAWNGAVCADDPTS